VTKNGESPPTNPDC